MFPFSLLLLQHVLVIGVDGMSPAGIAGARTPHLNALRARGASTMHARGVMPTSSSPNWASMIMGAGPEQHGVTSNDWEPKRFEIAPVAVDAGGRFPTIFGVLRAQRPKARVAVFHDWQGFGRLIEPGAADVLEHVKGSPAAAEAAAAYLRRNQPDLMFVHFDDVDHAGHETGHGTPRYLAAIEEIDALIGRLVAALEANRTLTRTAILVTSDHGGVGTKHGGATMAEIEIPWILAGPGAPPGKEIQSPVNTFDTAPTLARLLGIRPHPAWIGRAVAEAFLK